MTTQAIIGLTDTVTIIAAINENAGKKLKDENGNLIIANDRWMKYDSENRLIKVVMKNGNITTYEYDYEGNRIKLIEENTTTVYIGNIYEEVYNGTTLIESTKYIYAGSQRVAMKNINREVNYFLGDHLGSTSMIIDSNGQIARKTKYLPYGGTYISEAGTVNIDNAHKFTSQILDNNTNLYYYVARYYDPNLGTFITPDSIIQNPYDPQSLNRYTYCRNNPIIYTDPSGHYWWTPIVTGIAGAVYGAQSAQEMGYSFGDPQFTQRMITGAYFGAVGCGYFFGSASYDENRGGLSSNFFGGINFRFNMSNGNNNQNQIPLQNPYKSDTSNQIALFPPNLNDVITDYEHYTPMDYAIKHAMDKAKATLETNFMIRAKKSLSIYFKTLGKEMGLPGIVTTPEDAAIVGLESASVFYKGKAWSYASSKNLIYPTKSSVFRGFMSKASLFGKFSGWGTVALFFNAQYQALKAEWEYVTQEK